jgi:glutathione S-transferase
MALELVIANKNYSSWSLRAWLALAMTGAPFKETVVPLRRPETEAELSKHTPSGLVPVLKDGNVLVWESLAILEYVAERFPATGLWPKDIGVRALARSVSSEMHADFATLRREMPMNIRRSLPGRPRSPALTEDIARVCEIWRDCRARYGSGGPFLFGAFTNADAMYAPVATRFATYGVELHPTCAAYRDAVLDLPAMRTFADAARAEPWTIDEYEFG